MMLSTGTPPQPSPAAPTLQQQQQQQSAVAFQPMYPTSDGTGRGQEVRTPSTSMISFQSTGNLSHTSFNAMPMSSTAHSQQQQQSQAYAYAAQQQPQGHPPTTALAYHHQAQPPQQAATWDTTYTTTTTAANAAYAAAYAAGAAPQQQQHHQHAATDAQYATAQYATPTQFTYQQQAQPGYGPTPQQQPQAVAYPPPYPPTQQQQQPQQAQAPQTAYWQPAYSPAGPAGHHHIAAGQPQQYAQQQQQQQQPLMNAPPPGHHMTAIPAASAQPSYGLVAAHPSGGFVSASSMAAPAGGAEGPKQLIVNYLAPHVTSAQLHQLFSPFGPLDGARVIYDRHSGCPKGYGFVYFKHSQSAVAAIEKMNGYALHGKWLKVGYSTNPLTLAGTATA